MRHKKAYLTTDKATFDKVRKMKVGEVARIEIVNDIVSSTGGKAGDHYTLRRHSLLTRMIHGGFTSVMVRATADRAVSCKIVGCLSATPDACSVKVTVKRAA